MQDLMGLGGLKWDFTENACQAWVMRCLLSAHLKGRRDCCTCIQIHHLDMHQFLVRIN